MMHMQDGKTHSSRHSLMDATQQRAINNLKRHHGLKTLIQTTPQTHTHGEASPVKSPRLAIKNRVKTNMKTRTKKLKVCDA
jgi:hypothetical protein